MTGRQSTEAFAHAQLAEPKLRRLCTLQSVRHSTLILNALVTTWLLAAGRWKMVMLAIVACLMGSCRLALAPLVGVFVVCSVRLVTEGPERRHAAADGNTGLGSSAFGANCPGLLKRYVLPI